MDQQRILQQAVLYRFQDAREGTGSTKKNWEVQLRKTGKR